MESVQPTTKYLHDNDNGSTGEQQQNHVEERDSDSTDCDEESSGGDTCSVNSEPLKDNNNGNGALVLRGQDVNAFTKANGATFGSVAVTNSTDVHFGNKTYYQGPVTIKQILYAGQRDKIIGQDDLRVDGVIISNVEKKDNCAERDGEADKEGRDQQSNGGIDSTNKFVQKCESFKKSCIREEV